jgi:hypothetical protein
MRISATSAPHAGRLLTGWDSYQAFTSASHQVPLRKDLRELASIEPLPETRVTDSKPAAQ